LLAATDDVLDIHGDSVRIWRPSIAGEFHGLLIQSGRHQADEAPDQVAAALLESSPVPLAAGRPD
jgi:haloacetate dehalogenase